jgi:hypothetical protein
MLAIADPSGFNAEFSAVGVIFGRIQHVCVDELGWIIDIVVSTWVDGVVIGDSGTFNERSLLSGLGT